jgi:hypothetical protein
LEIAARDFNAVQKDRLLGTLEFVLSRLSWGNVIDAWYPIGSSGAELRLVSHLADPGTPSWEPHPFFPARLNAEIVVTGLVNDHCYLTARLSADTFAQYSLFGTTIAERFTFLLTSVFNDALEIQLWEHFADRADVARSEVYTFHVSELAVAPEVVVQLVPSGALRVRCIISDTPQALPFPLSAGEGYQCHLSIGDAAQIPGSRGTYFKCRFVKRPQVRLSRIALPLRNHASLLSLDVLSANAEILKVTLKRHRVNKKDKKLGRATVKLSKVGFGVFFDKWLELSPKSAGGVRLQAHFVSPRALPFVLCPYVPALLRVLIGEAVNLPKTDLMSQPDFCCKARLDTDLKWKETRTLNNTRTPQWYETIEWQVLGDYTAQTFVLCLYDINTAIDKKIAELKFPLAKIARGVISAGWYAVEGNAKVRLNLAFQIVLGGETGLSLEPAMETPLPPDLLTQ